jgi:RNA polymerase sigma-70 factor (ECF subfamily)
MDRVSAQDSAALEALYERYGSAVAGLGRRILVERGAVDDLVQETFWRVWTGAGSFRPSRGRFSSWLFGIAHHLAIDHLRRARSRPQALDQEQEAEGIDLETNVAEAAEISIVSALVREAFGALPSEQQRVLELAFFRGLSRREISETLGVPLGTIHTRARLGLLKLRAELQTRGYQE